MQYLRAHSTPAINFCGTIRDFRLVFSIMLIPPHLIFCGVLRDRSKGSGHTRLPHLSVNIFMLPKINNCWSPSKHIKIIIPTVKSILFLLIELTFNLKHFVSSPPYHSPLKDEFVEHILDLRFRDKTR